MIADQRQSTKQIASLTWQILHFGVAAIFWLAPFYTFLTIWLSSDVHHLDLLKSLEEFFLAFLALLATSLLFHYWRQVLALVKSRLFFLVALYCLLVIGVGLYDLLGQRVDPKAVAYGWLIDLRLFGIFAVAYLVTWLARQKHQPELAWQRLILLPAIIVIVFGFLQATVLAKDFLTHFGYGPHTTAAYQTVDNQPNIVRVQSTLRGANPLGAYLVLIIPLLVALATKVKDQRRWLWVGLSLLGLVVLFNTYSRSAELGLLLSLLVWVAIHQRRRLSKRWLGGALATIIVIVGLFVVFRNSYFVQNVVFHSSKLSHSQMSSNAERSSAIKTALKDTEHHPWGGGVGSAGPASRRNSKGPVKIAEDYYLQIAQEYGWLGLILFVGILLAVAYRLWHRRQELLPQILLASLVGISFINLLSHAWTDDTLAYVWWGLAGIALAPGILRTSISKKKET